MRDNERLGMVLSQIQSELNSIKRAGAGNNPTRDGLPLDFDDGYSAPPPAAQRGMMGAPMPRNISAQALQALLLETEDETLPVSECDLEKMQGEWVDEVRTSVRLSSPLLSWPCTFSGDTDLASRPPSLFLLHRPTQSEPLTLRLHRFAPALHPFAYPPTL